VTAIRGTYASFIVSWSRNVGKVEEWTGLLFRREISYKTFVEFGTLEIVSVIEMYLTL
jgi:hypothetical protein